MILVSCFLVFLELEVTLDDRLARLRGVADPELRPLTAFLFFPFPEIVVTIEPARELVLLRLVDFVGVGDLEGALKIRYVFHTHYFKIIILVECRI